MARRGALLLAAVVAAFAAGGVAMRAIVYHYRPLACHRSEAAAFHRNKFAILRVRSDCDGGATAVAWLELRYGVNKPLKFFEYEEAPADAAVIPTIAWTGPARFQITIAKVWVVRRMDNRVAGYQIDYDIGKILRPGGP